MHREVTVSQSKKGVKPLKMKILALFLIGGLVSTHELVHAQNGALQFGSLAGSKYCEARKQGRSHANALQLAIFDGTAAGESYAIRQGSIQSQNAQVDFNSYISSMCPQHLQDFAEGGVKGTTAVIPTGPSCLSSVDMYNGVQIGVIEKRCTDGGAIYIKVHR